MPRLIVDGSNVMGARPDGWWRDRAGARIRLTVEIDEVAAALVAVLLGDEQTGASGAGTDRTEVWVVHDGPEIPMQLRDVFVAFAGPADDRIVELTREGDVVVTADRELLRRVSARGATAVGPGRVLALLVDAKGG